jgi:uncharacterized membrane protein
MNSMRTLMTLCAVGVAAASLSACATSSPYDTAYERCRADRQNNQVAGALAGAAIGAFAGSAVAGNNSNTEGAVIGGGVGAAVGSQVAKGGSCDVYAYGAPAPRY